MNIRPSLHNYTPLNGDTVTIHELFKMTRWPIKLSQKTSIKATTCTH